MMGYKWNGLEWINENKEETERRWKKIKELIQEEQAEKMKKGEKIMILSQDDVKNLEQRNKELNEQLNNQCIELKETKEANKSINDLVNLYHEGFEELTLAYISVREKMGKIIGYMEPNTLSEFAKEAYRNAKEKGFHDEIIDPKYEIPMKIALMHSELSEALEEIRKGKKVDEVYYVNGKPEGVLPELADVFIRLMDFIGKFGLENKFEEVVREKMNYNSTRPKMHGKKF